MKTQRSHRYVTRFLAFSFTGFLLISIAVFGLLVFFMDQKSNKSIYKVGELYMSGMNREISKNFENVIDLRFRQVEGIITAVTTKNSNKENLYNELVYRAQIRDFEYLALCSDKPLWRTSAAQESRAVCKSAKAGGTSGGDRSGRKRTRNSFIWC